MKKKKWNPRDNWESRRSGKPPKLSGKQQSFLMHIDDFLPGEVDDREHGIGLVKYQGVYRQAYPERRVG